MQLIQTIKSNAKQALRNFAVKSNEQPFRGSLRWLGESKLGNFIYSRLALSVTMPGYKLKNAGYQFQGTDKVLGDRIYVKGNDTKLMPQGIKEDLLVISSNLLFPVPGTYAQEAIDRGEPIYAIKVDEQGNTVQYPIITKV